MVYCVYENITEEPHLSEVIKEDNDIRKIVSEKKKKQPLFHLIIGIGIGHTIAYHMISVFLFICFCCEIKHNVYSTNALYKHILL